MAATVSSTNENKTILTVGAVAIGGYVAYKLLSKRRSNSSGGGAYGSGGGVGQSAQSQPYYPYNQQPYYPQQQGLDLAALINGLAKMFKGPSGGAPGTATAPMGGLLPGSKGSFTTESIADALRLGNTSIDQNTLAQFYNEGAGYGWNNDRTPGDIATVSDTSLDGYSIPNVDSGGNSSAFDSWWSGYSQPLPDSSGSSSSSSTTGDTFSGGGYDPNANFYDTGSSGGYAGGYDTSGGSSGSSSSGGYDTSGSSGGYDPNASFYDTGSSNSGGGTGFSDFNPGYTNNDFYGGNGP